MGWGDLWEKNEMARIIKKQLGSILIYHLTHRVWSLADKFFLGFSFEFHSNQEPPGYYEMKMNHVWGEPCPVWGGLNDKWELSPIIRAISFFSHKPPHPTVNKVNQI